MLFTPSLFSQSLGPLEGKNLYLPHLPYYSFPNRSPRIEDEGIGITTQLYWINEFYLWGLPSGGKEQLALVPDPDYYIAMDYESLVVEQGICLQDPQWGRINLDFRVLGYFQGIGDPFIEAFHDFWGVPNAGREYFQQNRLFLDLWGTSGPYPSLYSTKWLLGDVDISYQREIHWLHHWDISWTGALKIPMGDTLGLGGSGSLDLGLQLAGLRNWNRFSLHLQTGLVWPLHLLNYDTAHGRLSSQTMIGLEFRPSQDWAILAQVHLITSPQSSIVERHTTLPVELWAYQSLQTDIKLGVRHRRGPWMFQFYFEEDPITYEGADIILNLGCSYFFKGIPW